MHQQPYGNQHGNHGQPGYGQPGYGQPGFSQPSPHGTPSSSPGYTPPPPPAYTPPTPEQQELNSLKDDANLWLLVTAAGFWFGFGWITGPLGWYFGGQARSKYRALGHHPCSAANWAFGLGIATTIITWLGIFLVLAVVAVAFGFFAAAM